MKPYDLVHGLGFHAAAQIFLQPDSFCLVAGTMDTIDAVVCHRELGKYKVGYVKRGHFGAKNKNWPWRDPIDPEFCDQMIADLQAAVAWYDEQSKEPDPWARLS